MALRPPANALAYWAQIGLTANLLEGRTLTWVPEAKRLVPVGLGTDQRDKFLTPKAARAWQDLQARAAQDGITLALVSAFRSYAFQTLLFTQKLQRGDRLEDILLVNAPPGTSEHHGGNAVDIGTQDVHALDVAFAHTPAFAWLREYAPGQGWRMSYPPGNPQGFMYEPWHWCWHA